MNLIFLKYFYDTGKEKSVAKSAGLNFVSPPAISNGIRKLENDLGIELLKHGRNKIELTKEGIALLKACEDIFSLVDKTKIKIKSGDIDANQHIRLGITNGLNQEFLPLFLKSFGKKYPNYNVTFKVGSPNQLKSWIQEKEIDFALTISRDKPQNYQYIMIHQGTFKFICHTNFKKKKEDESFILTGNWPEVESFKKEYFKRYKKLPLIKYEAESWGTIKNFVAQGHGIGIVPDYHILKGKSPVREYSYPLKLNSYLILALFEKGTYLSQANFHLVENFKEFVSESIST
jgi:LysR family carnitine catabolism transcriptional activator